MLHGSLTLVGLDGPTFAATRRRMEDFALRTHRRTSTQLWVAGLEVGRGDRGDGAARFTSGGGGTWLAVGVIIALGRDRSLAD